MTQASSAYARLTLAAFSEALASDEPTPGGGSASAVAASLAASLAVMVARLSQGRPRYAAYATTQASAIATAEAARMRFLELADEDAVAYAAFGAARRMQHRTPEEEADRERATHAAAARAAEVPLATVRLCHALAVEIERLAGRSNLNAASDLDVAAQLGLAAARGAGANVLTNIPMMGDQRTASAMLSEVEARLHEIESSVARIHAQVRSGNLRAPESP